jgi:site-specific DNA-methyltransferase (adenine-specific)
MALLGRLADKSVDWAVVDPPYGTPDTAKRKTSHFSKRRHKERSRSRLSSWCLKYSSDRPLLWDEAPGREYFDELFRVSKEQIIWGGNYFHLPTSRNFVIWDKKFGDSITFAQADYAWVSRDGTASIYRKSPVDKNRFHPTQKPVNLYIWLLEKFTKIGDLILDTHFGSGSLAVACALTGRHFIGSEIDAEYHAKAVERVERETNGLLFYDGRRENNETFTPF